MEFGREYIIYPSDQIKIDKPHTCRHGIVATDKGLVCNRCHLRVTAKCMCTHCQKECYYCRECIRLGKITQCSKLIAVANQVHHSSIEYQWEGVLSTYQQQLSDDLVKHYDTGKNVLISAVTGSGKTEMIFACLNKALQQGKRVCICAPRVDVCLELMPRIQAIFPKEEIMLMYGQQEEHYSYTRLVISTTHQLLKFYHCFDVVFLDESDSFPFYNNPMLENHIDDVLTPTGQFIFLTATPTEEQLYKVKQEGWEHLFLAGRYHRHALPVPKSVYIGNWSQNLCRKQGAVYRLIHQFLQYNKRFIVFFPNISKMQECYRFLNDNLSGYTFDCVHAQDIDRIDKVNRMREQAYDFLLTTTILERGVTFENINVLVIGSENAVYTTASLVQIAGRVGRKPRYPSGIVVFAHNGKSYCHKQAIRWIKKMNVIALQKGVIDA